MTWRSAISTVPRRGGEGDFSISILRKLQMIPENSTLHSAERLVRTYSQSRVQGPFHLKNSVIAGSLLYRLNRGNSASRFSL